MILYTIAQLTPEHLEKTVIELLENDEKRQQMADAASRLAVIDSAEQLANIVREASPIAR